MGILLLQGLSGALFGAALFYLLASLLSLERLFANDYEDGGLDLLALSPLPLEACALAKVAAHWLVTGLPLIAAAATALCPQPGRRQDVLGHRRGQRVGVSQWRGGFDPPDAWRAVRHDRARG